MTNFAHFDKPVIHFGNAHEQKPEPPAETAPATEFVAALEAWNMFDPINLGGAS